jgi:nicotinamide-nucleotide amidase
MSELEILAERLGRELLARGERLATAESCTGGWVAQTVTAIAGSSEWFDCGVVTYSNESKMALLGVAEDTLATHGAVSEATARAMALGAVKRSRADWAVAVTGIAGPSGGTPQKPVGMGCFAWAQRGGNCEALTCQFAGDRAGIREQAVRLALSGTLKRVIAATLMA